MAAKVGNLRDDSEDYLPEPLISVVIPARDESGSIEALIEEIGYAFASHAFSEYEVVVVDDGSTDRTGELVRGLCDTNENLRIVQLHDSMGQSAAVCFGVLRARAEWIATLDGDGQNDPSDIWRLWKAAQRQAENRPSVLVIGERVKRMDSQGRHITSWVLRRLSAICLRHEVVDKGSGLKIFRRRDFLALPRFDHMHRFLPGLFRLLDADIISIPANHRARLSGSSHYKNLARIREAIVDVAGIMWLQRRFIRIPIEEER